MATPAPAIAPPRTGGTQVVPRPASLLAPGAAGAGAPAVAPEPEEPEFREPLGHLVQPLLMKLIWLFAFMAAFGAGVNAYNNESDIIGIAWRSAGSAAVVAAFGSCMLKPLFFSLKYSVAETQDKLAPKPLPKKPA